MAISIPPSPAAAQELARLGFKPDTAYMEVPRCDGCVFFKRQMPMDQNGHCQTLNVPVTFDFGCILRR